MGWDLKSLPLDKASAWWRIWKERAHLLPASFWSWSTLLWRGALWRLAGQWHRFVQILYLFHFVLPVRVVEILTPQSTWPHVQRVDPAAHLVPNGHHHVSFLPSVHVRRGLSQPVAQVLSLGPWDSQLWGAVGDEDPKWVPCQWIYQGSGDSLSDQGIFEPPKSSVRGAWAGNQPVEVLVHGGDEKVHLFELVELSHLANYCHHTQPPVLASEAKLGANQWDWLFADLCRRNCLGLPCLEF